MMNEKMKEIKFEDLKGQIITKINGNVGEEEIIFELENGDMYRLIYHQDCCAECSIEDICGDMSDLIGYPVLVAEEATNRKENPEGFLHDEYQVSFTWTYYKLDTIKGGVTIRWYGESNGYYSEEATFEKKLFNKSRKEWGWQNYV